MTTDAQVARLAALDTCTVSDALDALGRPGALVGIAPTWECGPVSGRVRTVQLGPHKEATGGPPVHLGARAIAGAHEGDVIVVDNRAGNGESAGWGGLLALAAKIRGVAGVVVYGAARDIDDVAKVEMPMFAHSVTTRTARARTVEVATDEPLQLEDVRVAPGDLILADRSGVVVVAARRGRARARQGGGDLRKGGRDGSCTSCGHRGDRGALGKVRIDARAGRGGGMTPDLVPALRRLGTAAVSDALDRLGIDGQASRIARMTGSETVAGEAFTVQYVPVGTERAARSVITSTTSMWGRSSCSRTTGARTRRSGVVCCPRSPSLGASSRR